MELGSGSKPVNLCVHKVLKLVMADRDFCLIGSWTTNANGQGSSNYRASIGLTAVLFVVSDAGLKVLTVDQLLQFMKVKPMSFLCSSRFIRSMPIPRTCLSFLSLVNR